MQGNNSTHQGQQVTFDDLRNNPGISPEQLQIVAYLDSRIGNLQSSFNTYKAVTDAKIDELEQDLQELREESREDVGVAMDRATEKDPCEIKFSGFPPTDPADYKSAVTAVLHFIGCPDLAQYIYRVRRWTVPPPPPRNEASQASRKPPAPLPLTIVAKFLTSDVRDLVMSYKPALRGKTIADVYRGRGTQSRTPVYMDCLSAPGVHQLTRSAWDLAKKLGLPGPRSRGDVLYMKRSPTSPDVRIRTPRELAAFEATCPNPQQRQDNTENGNFVFRQNREPMNPICSNPTTRDANTFALTSSLSKSTSFVPPPTLNPDSSFSSAQMES